uniref:Uncharacterized protein n=1 Tax=Anguilla anguilla TaxID=7936 RepID=A0A0E9SLX6_ANGAN
MSVTKAAALWLHLSSVQAEPVQV